MTQRSPLPFARTKIVATLGPASSEPRQLEALATAGVDVFRINMAHGTREEHDRVFAGVRAVSEKQNRPLAILVDLGGPKIRLGKLPGEAVECQDGAEFRFIRGETSNSPGELVTSYERLVDELEPGDRVLLADGTVAMIVVRKEPDAAVVRVDQAGIIRSRQGVNLPGAKLSVQALTDYDRECARWAVGVGADYLGLSFVRRAADIEQLKQLLHETAGDGPVPDVIAKIEKPEALDNLEAIVLAADGLMVARGDLGVETDVATLAVAQKRIIAACHRLQKPVITATQMLDSMQHGKQPTRAEATDVANAILDGTDACMLSGETAVGVNPLAAVQMMERIARATEPMFRELPRISPPEIDPRRVSQVSQAAIRSACEMAEQLDARFLVVASHSGTTALAVAKQRAFVPVVGVSDQPETLRQMCLYWGVTPLPGVPTGDVTELIGCVEQWAKRESLLATGDRMVVLASTHWEASGHNTVVVHELD